MSDIQAGYYMIIQTNAASDNAYSVAVVSTAYAGENGLTVTLKREVPKLTKKVKDVNDSTGDETDWQDSADYDVNDYVPFQLTGTMPKNIAAYTTYAYTFHDTMSEGLTFVNDKDHPVKVYAVNGETKTEIKTGYDVVTTGLANKETFNVKFADLKLAEDAKGTAITINENTKIVVEYYGQLNEQSKIGAEGNPNRAYLEYENNPEAEGEGTGKTLRTRSSSSPTKLTSTRSTRTALRWKALPSCSRRRTPMASGSRSLSLKLLRTEPAIPPSSSAWMMVPTV